MINLNHPGIPIVYDVEEDYNYTCIIEQYIEGESLGALCSHRLLSEEEIYSFIIRIGSVIEYLHEQQNSVVFLDLKPENVIISEGEAWLVDFASARNLKSDCAVSAMSASPGYTAPEQEKNIAVGKSADMFALGRLLEYMVSHSNLGPGAQRRLNDIAKRCTRECPWKRIGTPGILLKMLNRQRKAETAAHPAKPDGLPVRKYRRIGVLGLKPGEGATTVAIALAHSLAKLNERHVLLIEKSDHADFGYVYDASTQEGDDGQMCTRYRRVTYAASGAAVNEAVLAKDADCIVYDLGSSAKRAAGTLADCELCIAVAGAAPWRRHMYNFLERPEYEGLKGLNWVLIINRADRDVLKEIAGCGIPMYVFTHVDDPTRPDKDTVGFFERMIR